MKIALHNVTVGEEHEHGGTYLEPFHLGVLSVMLHWSLAGIFHGSFLHTLLEKEKRSSLVEVQLHNPKQAEWKNNYSAGNRAKMDS